MRKIFLFCVLLLSLLVGCAGEPDSKTVPVELLDEFVETRYGFSSKDPGDRGTCPVTVDYQATHYIGEKGRDTVTIDVTTSSEICTKTGQIVCEYVCVDDVWSLERYHSETEFNTEWHFENFVDVWWRGGAGLTYRAFMILGVDRDAQTMVIWDSNGREYTTDYTISEREISVKIKYDIAEWGIYQNGPVCIGGYMKKD